MTIHRIESLLPGPLELDIELPVLLDLPITLSLIERTNDHAPDYRLDAGEFELGHGWSKTSPVSGIPYIAVIIASPSGKRVSGVAWQSPDHAGRWSMQLQETCSVALHS